MLQVVPVAAFKDNYVWTLRNASHAAVVDPGEARPVLDYLKREGLTLAAILATHHHPDHVGGIAELLRSFDVPVYGPKNEPIATLTQPVSEGDRLRIVPVRVRPVRLRQRRIGQRRNAFPLRVCPFAAGVATEPVVGDVPAACEQQNRQQ